jgi:very-short-patch-repair endonuclease
MPGKRETKKAGGQVESEAFAPPSLVLPVPKGENPPEEDPAQRFAEWSRQVPTKLEQKVWKMLGGPNNPWKFRTQVVIGPYIADFLSRKVMMCIEADGPEHLKTVEEDNKRDAWFEKQGILTLRLTYADFVRNTPQRLYALVEEMASAKNMVKVDPKKGQK